MKNIAIVIPTFNELENIEKLIHEIKIKLPEAKIFIIDDSKTKEIGELINNNTISERRAIISSYALCGFANFGSIGIQLGGIGGMAPDRRKDLSKLGMKAMIGGALASWLTATIAGILI